MSVVNALEQRAVKMSDDPIVVECDPHLIARVVERVGEVRH